MLYEDTSRVDYGIVDGDPLSARVEVVTTLTSGREDWRVEIKADATMTSTATAFLTTSRLEVCEDGVRIFARTWDHSFPRDLM